MLNHSVTNEVATILCGEQLTLRDSLDEAATETTQANEATSEPTHTHQVIEEVAPAYRVVANTKPLDDSCTLGVVAFPTIMALAGKWEPP